MLHVCSKYTLHKYLMYTLPYVHVYVYIVYTECICSMYMPENVNSYFVDLRVC